jgi:sulfur relay protein TusB/DsrH
MNLYILDKPFGENGMRLAAQDDAAMIVLIQDGVYMNCSELHMAGRKIYALKRDVEKRGLAFRLPNFVILIDYVSLVDLIVENRVINFT